MVEMVTKNGAAVVINVAPFRDAMALKNIIGKELVATGGRIDLRSDVTAVMLTIDSSEAVYKALFVCLSRCTYNSQKIIEATFESEAAREDYYEVVVECLKANLSPFLKGLLSKLKELENLFPAKNSPTSK